jgi:cholest-4-en-3-one 26-monooxygenase
MAAALTADQIDVFSSDVYVAGVPHEQFAWLRAQPGMLKQRIADPQLEDEAFIAARHADVLAVAKDAAHFTIEDGHNVRRARGTRALGPNLLTMDDPDHLTARMWANRSFTPKVIRRHTEHYRALANAILDAALPQRVFDFVTDVSMRLPLAAICELLGAPREDYDRIIGWSNAIIGSEDGEYGGSVEARWEAFSQFAT